MPIFVDTVFVDTLSYVATQKILQYMHFSRQIVDADFAVEEKALLLKMS